MPPEQACPEEPPRSGVLKMLLEELPRGEFPEADQILKACDAIEPLEDKYVPENSLIREFIGGSSYHAY